MNAGRGVDTLLPLVKERFGSGPQAGYSLLIDGFVNRFEANKSIWPVIWKIHKRCKIGLLTNMYPGMLDAIGKEGLLPKEDWDVIIDSSKVGIAKPDPRIFGLAERLAGVTGDEILFVDNNQTNIDAARKLGWQTFPYDPKAPEVSSGRLAALF